MKSERILAAMGGIDDKLVEAAEPQAAGKRRDGFKKAAVAACLAAALVGGIALHGQFFAPDTANLPVLDISLEGGANGFGFEGYMVHDISELTSANPWTETASIKTLPVYRNPVEYDRAGGPVSPVSSELLDAMRGRLLGAAERLGLENVQAQDNAPTQEEVEAVREKFDGEVPEGYFAPTEVTAGSGGVKLTVGADMAVRIDFEPAVALPEGFNGREGASYEDTKAVVEYVAEQYRELLDMDRPQAEAVGGDRNIYDQPDYQMEVFDAAGDLAERILNYNFNAACFYCNSEGELWIIRLNRPDLSQKVGDYPVISAKEARELLCTGSYISTVQVDMPGEAYIAKVELVYRTGWYDEYFMPYYRFYVELPEKVGENGLKTYGAYYVPAVPGEFLTGMPQWEGQFN